MFSWPSRQHHLSCPHPSPCTAGTPTFAPAAAASGQLWGRRGPLRSLLKLWRVRARAPAACGRSRSRRGRGAARQAWQAGGCLQLQLGLRWRRRPPARVACNLLGLEGTALGGPRQQDCRRSWPRHGGGRGGGGCLPRRSRRPPSLWVGPLGACQRAAAEAVSGCGQAGTAGCCAGSPRDQGGRLPPLHRQGGHAPALAEASWRRPGPARPQQRRATGRRARSGPGQGRRR